MAQGHPTVHLDGSPEMFEFNCEKNKPASSGRVITAIKTIDLLSGLVLVTLLFTLIIPPINGSRAPNCLNLIARKTSLPRVVV